jgi:hypothetical protein
LHTKLWFENLMGINHLEDQQVNVRVTSDRLQSKDGERMRTKSFVQRLDLAHMIMDI